MMDSMPNEAVGWPGARKARAELKIEDAASVNDVITERHRGIRPGFGYPACPDHSEKFKLFDLLGARELGIEFRS
jgi:5-methyltetrahydrofolate--homocysteine methyltransferase